MIWILWTAAPWKALPSEYPPYQTCHRRMQEWVADRVFWKILTALATDLRERGKIDLTKAFIDGTHAGAKRGALSSELLAVDPQQMAIADARGLPIAVGLASGPCHEAPLVEATLGRKFVRGRLLRLIGDKAYDSNKRDAALRKRGIDMISPNHSTRKLQNQDGRKLRRYKRRWLVERVFAWLMRSRRLVTRYEHKAAFCYGVLEMRSSCAGGRGSRASRDTRSCAR
jgi:transposase